MAIFDPGQRDYGLAMPSADDRAFSKAGIKPCAAVARHDPLPATQPRRLQCRQSQRRDAVQRSLDRKEMPPVSRYMRSLRHRIQCERLVFREAADREATQLSDMSERAERRPQVTGECPDVSPLANERFAVRMVAVRYPDETQFRDLYRSRGQSRPRYESVCVHSSFGERPRAVPFGGLDCGTSPEGS